MKNLGLTYCTNVHALGDWTSWSGIIGRFGPAVRGELGWAGLPLGLWFPAALISEFSSDMAGAEARIKTLMSDKKLSTFTCNAFPYGNFHDKSVKTKVYHPDWTTRERLEYTIACAKLMAALAPESFASGEASVSTLPLGWRIGWTDAQTRAAAENLCRFACEARNLAVTGGRTVRLGIEPEPGCVLETADQVIAFWDAHLRPAAQRAGLSASDLENFLGVCYDTCHQAVQFEDPIEVLEKLRANGIRIVKMQLSSALEFKPDPGQVTRKLREAFVEERFLHQTRVKTAEGVIGFDDLPQALAAARPAPSDLWAHPWRTHFHLPIDGDGMLDSADIATTRGDMLKAYAYAVENDLCRHFEVETYTWSVLPEAHRPKDDAELGQCLARELRFIETHTPSGVAINGGRHA